MKGLTQSSDFPEEVKLYFRRTLLGERCIVVDGKMNMIELFVLPEDLNGGNKGQGYGNKK